MNNEQKKGHQQIQKQIALIETEINWLESSIRGTIGSLHDHTRTIPNDTVTYAHGVIEHMQRALAALQDRTSRLHEHRMNLSIVRSHIQTP